MATVEKTLVLEDVQAALVEKGWPEINVPEDANKKQETFFIITFKNETNDGEIYKCRYDDAREINIWEYKRAMFVNRVPYVMIYGVYKNNRLVWKQFGTEKEIPQYKCVYGTKEYINRIMTAAEATPVREMSFLTLFSGADQISKGIFLVLSLVALFVAIFLGNTLMGTLGSTNQ